MRNGVFHPVRRTIIGASGNRTMAEMYLELTDYEAAALTHYLRRRLMTSDSHHSA